MYNTQFQVKYNDIEQELLIKCEKNQNIEYTKQDVLDICDKLYRDELLSVFLGDQNIENININQLSNCITDLYNTRLVKTQFKHLIDEISTTCSLTNDIVLISLFSHQLFHLTHKCICQIINTEIIDISLFLQLKYLTSKLLMDTNTEILSIMG
jgi:hypothetical protein